VGNFGTLLGQFLSTGDVHQHAPPVKHLIMPCWMLMMLLTC